MKPQAYEALQKAKALFRHPAEVDDIPESVTQAVEPIRKPRVVLLPPNAPKFDAKTIEEEHKKMDKQKQDLAQAVAKQKQTDKYVDMSTNEACADCIKMGISKPSEIAKVTGKKVKQIYTSLWNIRKGNIKKFKKVAKKMPPAYECIAKPQAPQQVKAKDNEWDREPTAYEDAHRVVLKNRDEYEAQITEQKETIMRLHNEITRLKIVVEYLEGRTK